MNNTIKKTLKLLNNINYMTEENDTDINSAVNRLIELYNHAIESQNLYFCPRESMSCKLISTPIVNEKTSSNNLINKALLVLNKINLKTDFEDIDITMASHRLWDLSPVKTKGTTLYFVSNFNKDKGTILKTYHEVTINNEAFTASPILMNYGHTELQYLYSTWSEDKLYPKHGTGPYFDTNFYPSDKSRIVLSYRFPNYFRYKGSWVMQFRTVGCTDLISNPNICISLGTNDRASYSSIECVWSNAWTTPSRLRWYTDSVRRTYDIQNGSQKVDGSENLQLTMSSAKSPVPFTLFGRANASPNQPKKYFVNNCGPGDFYYCQLFEDGVLVQDLVPVKINTLNYVWLYDKVTNRYIPSSGTGVFMAGPAK